MRCVLLGLNAKVFAKAVQSLAKFGKELFIEAEDDGLELHTLNNAESSFGSFRFYRSFFDEYDNVKRIPQSQAESEFENSCQISMKACIGVFKNMRLVERCIIRIDTKSNKLNIQFLCKMDTVKTHQIAIVDVDRVMPAFDFDSVPNKIVASNKLWLDIMNHFTNGEEEITFDVEAVGIKIRNYVEGDKKIVRNLRTQLGLKDQEFDEFTIGQETSVTFPIREFKAFLMFAECVNANVLLKFEECGRPIGIIVKDFNAYEAKLVVATLDPSDVSIMESSSGNNSQASIEPVVPKASKRNVSTTSTANKRRKKEEKVTGEVSIPDVSLTIPETTSNSSINHTIEKARRNSSSDVIAHSIVLTQNRRDTVLPSAQDVSRFHPAPTILENESESNFSLTFKNTEDLDFADSIIQQSPGKENNEQPGKLRNIFSRCFEATYIPKEPSPTDDFVPDSDEEGSSERSLRSQRRRKK